MTWKLDARSSPGGNSRVAFVDRPMTGRSEKQATEERGVFERCVRAYPSFAKDVVSSRQPDEWPDIEARQKSGALVPIELAEWIHGEQLAEARKKPLDGGAYDPAVALDAVQRIVAKKLSRYG